MFDMFERALMEQAHITKLENANSFLQFWLLSPVHTTPVVSGGRVHPPLREGGG